jgi:hypothetical protein
VIDRTLVHAGGRSTFVGLVAVVVEFLLGIFIAYLATLVFSPDSVRDLRNAARAARGRDEPRLVGPTPTRDLDPNALEPDVGSVDSWAPRQTHQGC